MNAMSLPLRSYYRLSLSRLFESTYQVKARFVIEDRRKRTLTLTTLRDLRNYPIGIFHLHIIVVEMVELLRGNIFFEGVLGSRTAHLLVATRLW